MLFQAQDSALGASNRYTKRLLTFNNSVIYISRTGIWTFDYQIRPGQNGITAFFRNFS